MFAYCNNNPVMNTDYAGNIPKAFPAYFDDNYPDKDSAEKVIFERLLDAMTDDRRDGRTFSFGFTVGSVWDGTGGGKGICLSVDNTHNYAIQESDSILTSTGLGTSAGMVFTITNAKNVQDLAGPSNSRGLTLCGVFGLSIDLIDFIPASEPDTICWGISVSLLFGADADIHRGVTYSTSGKSYNPLKELNDFLFGG